MLACSLLPKGDSFSVLTASVTGLQEHALFFKLIQSPAKTPDSLLGFLVLNESSLKWLAAEKAPSTRSPPSHLRFLSLAPSSYSNTVSRETKSSESNVQTMVKLTNFQNIAPSHVQPLFCPLLYIPSPARAHGVWTPIGNVALSLVSLRFTDGGERRKKK